ncbi:MAG: GNAT family N-acetyltransferase [Acidimicrobiales bacterium]
MEAAARPAAAADLPRLVELINAAIAELQPTRGGALYARREARPDPSVAGLRSLVDDDSSAAFVGTIDDTAMGVATVRLEELRDGGRLAVVDELYVEEGARGVGVGEAMMNAVLAWAAARDCEGVDAMVLPGNRETKNFYESFGLTARAIVVHRRLAPEPPE